MREEILDSDLPLVSVNAPKAERRIIHRSFHLTLERTMQGRDQRVEPGSVSARARWKMQFLKCSFAIGQELFRRALGPSRFLCIGAKFHRARNLRVLADTPTLRSDLSFPQGQCKFTVAIRRGSDDSRGSYGRLMSQPRAISATNHLL